HHQALADALLPELRDPVIAKWVIAPAPEGAVRRPRAAGAARVGVVAGPAVPPELLRVAVAREAHDLGVLPDLLERELADVTAGVRRRRERWARLDRSVGLDPENVDPAPTAAPVRLA